LNGVSFGHGEVFQFAGRYYLIFHVRETLGSSSPIVGGAGRTVYIKELYFNEATGSILPISCDQTDPTLDVDVFLAPYVGTGSNSSGGGGPVDP
jgi:hypothetical protein